MASSWAICPVGPRTPLYCAGAQLQANYPVSVIVDGVGLNMTVLSYRDHLDFGIVADREQIGDAWPLMQGLAAALRELEAAIGGPAPGSRTPRTRAPVRPS